MKHIWEKMRKFNRTYNYNNKKFLNSTWLHDFLHKYTPDAVEYDLPHFCSSNFTSVNTYLINNFTIAQLKSALKSRKNSTSGLDDLNF